MVQADYSDEDLHGPSVPPEALELTVNAPSGAQPTPRLMTAGTCVAYLFQTIPKPTYCLNNRAGAGHDGEGWDPCPFESAAHLLLRMQNINNRAGAGHDGEDDQGKERRPLTRQEKLQRAWDEYYRKQANQRRAALQQVLHRTSALCTLAHGLLLDQAANDPMLQVGLCTHVRLNACLSSFVIISPACPVRGEITTAVSAGVLQASCWQGLGVGTNSKALTVLVLQAIALSLVDSAAQPRGHESKGISAAGLEPAVAWFCKAFSVLSTEDALKQVCRSAPLPLRCTLRMQTPGETANSCHRLIHVLHQLYPCIAQGSSYGRACMPILPSLKLQHMQAEEAPAGGLELAVERLQAVAAAQAGTPEELVALFVATMRAHGLLARSIRQAIFSMYLPRLTQQQG